MKKFKICHIITKLELGGAQQNTLYTVSHLDKEKFEPSLIAGKGGILDSEALQLSGVKTILIPHLVREQCPATDFLGFIELWLTLLREKPDVVHTHSSKAGILGRWAAFFAGIPVIIHTFHGFGFHDFQNKIVRSFYVLIERITAKITHKLIVVSSDNISKGLKNSIGRKEQYMVIRSGIDISKYKDIATDKENKRKELNIPSNSRIITTIGPFKPQKNLKDFINVASKIVKKQSDIIFIIIGDGEQRPALELLIQGLDIYDKVRLTGWRRDVNEILSITDIFVLTSLWEGLPRSILEAMSAGIPVVANAVDGVKEIVKDGETGYLTEPFQTDKMSDIILKLLDNEPLARRMGKRGQESISQEFDIGHMVRQQENLYIKLNVNGKQ